MSQINQALEVVRDLARMKARLAKNQAQLNMVLNSITDTPDGSIQRVTRGRLEEIHYALDILIGAINSFTLN